jgi:hypothetical protein
MTKNEELEKRISENMALFGGTHEFWERRLTHGWDALEAKLSELKAQGLTEEQIFDKWVKGSLINEQKNHSRKS